MRLIGMLDSPYVRRVAISLEMMGLAFTHESLSVFRDMDAFKAVNPVIKAPTLVTADGVTIMDSTLILQHANCLVTADRRLSPTEPRGMPRAFGWSAWDWHWLRSRSRSCTSTSSARRTRSMLRGSSA